MQWLHLLAENFLSLITTQHIFVGDGEKIRARVIKFIDEENSTIIHNGIDYEHIGRLPSERNEVLKSINCPSWESKTLIGTISRLSPEKGITNLLSAFSEVIEKKYITGN